MENEPTGDCLVDCSIVGRCRAPVPTVDPSMSSLLTSGCEDIYCLADQEPGGGKSMPLRKSWQKIPHHGSY